MAEGDELFNKFIVVDEGNDKENKEEKIAKKPKATEKQYARIAAFFQEHDENTLEKSVMNELWVNLAAELNDIGPPEFTEAEWRRKWSIRKYNDKKRLVKALAESETACEAGHSSTEITVDAQQMIYEKLEEISIKQDMLLKNQTIMKEDLNALKTFSKQNQQ